MKLLMEDGTEMSGHVFGAAGSVCGEVVQHRDDRPRRLLITRSIRQLMAGVRAVLI
jgi:hypothetical protein